MRQTTRRTLAPVCAMALVMCLTSAASAQGPGPGGIGLRGAPGSGQPDNVAVRPPRVQDVDKATPLLHYAVGIGVVALCVGVVVLPGRREHND